MRTTGAMYRGVQRTCCSSPHTCQSARKASRHSEVSRVGMRGRPGEAGPPCRRCVCAQDRARLAGRAAKRTRLHPAAEQLHNTSCSTPAPRTCLRSFLASNSRTFSVWPRCLQEGADRVVAAVHAVQAEATGMKQAYSAAVPGR